MNCGRALGGSSSINGMMFTPTSKTHVDAWAGLGNEGWEWSTFNDAVKKVHSGSDAPIQLSVVDTPEGTWIKVWTDTMKALGFPLSDPFSGETLGSVVTPESINRETKTRSSAANAYLGPAKERKNLTVLTGAVVQKILFDMSDAACPTAEGISFVQGGEKKIIKATKEVILSGGAINSPRLLELSGIGGSKLLKSLDIPVTVDNPHVGENLQNHPLCAMVFTALETSPETIDALAAGDPPAIGAAMQAYAVDKSGPFASSGLVTSAQLPYPYISTDEGRKDLNRLLHQVDTEVGNAFVPPGAPTTQAFAAKHEALVHSVNASPEDASATWMAMPLFVPGYDVDVMSPPRTGKGFTIGAQLNHPLSRGSVHINTNNPEITGSSEGLTIDPAYLSHPLDVEILARHLQFLEQRIVRAQPLAGCLKLEAEPRLKDLETAKAFVRRSATGAHHYAGTCGMMPREMGGVVDARLRVYGCKGLRVCDASVVPLVPRVNPQATVYGVAEMGAKLILEDLSKS
jgi:choline dehydrogenase-like flavoprotein